MKKLSILLIVLMALGLLIGITGCGGGEAEENGDEEALVIDAAADAVFAPFEFKGESGEVEGFDADLIRAIGEAEGIETTIKHIDWDGLFPALESGDINVIISGMTITEERKAEYDFSDPYFEATQIICVREDSDIDSLDDLVGKSVGVQQNTTGHFAVQKIEGMKDEDIKKFPYTPDALMNLSNGLVEAVVGDAPVVLNYITTNPDCGFKTIESDEFEKEYYGICVKKGNTELLERINSGLKKIQEDGTYDEIYKKYFGE
ncbi:MAG TPA: basic amino acid ABC transporter substrate-binding protein [Clostridia bacterium]|nr:basic amino acid ABC transporter substrate-binding protein [Clostridia bacterium]